MEKSAERDGEMACFDAGAGNMLRTSFSVPPTLCSHGSMVSMLPGVIAD